MKKLLILFLLLPLMSLAQQDCLDQLMKITERYSAIRPDSGQVHFYQYRISYTYRNGVKKEGLIKAYSKGKQQHIVTGEYELYQHNGNIAMLLPSSKILRFMKAMDEKEKSRLNFPEQQKKLLTESKVIKCEEVQGNDKYDNLIQLKPEETKTGEQVKLAEYFISKKKNEIHKVIFTYPETSSVVSISIIYEISDLNYTGYDFPVTLEEIFFDQPGKLKKSYRDYKIIDLRK
jgi:hypothetical protein